MAATELTLDKLRALCGLARSLGDLCESAATNADSDSVSADPMLKSVRKQYLAVKSMGDDFLTLDRPPVTKKVTATLIAQWESDTSQSWPDATPAGSVSQGQWETLCFAAGTTAAECLAAWQGV